MSSMSPFYVIIAEARHSKYHPWSTMERDYAATFKDAVEIARKFETFSLLPWDEHEEERDMRPDTYGSSGCGDVYIIEKNGFSTLGNEASGTVLRSCEWDDKLQELERQEEPVNTSLRTFSFQVPVTCVSDVTVRAESKEEALEKVENWIDCECSDPYDGDYCAYDMSNFKHEMEEVCNA